MELKIHETDLNTFEMLNVLFIIEKVIIFLR